MLLLTQFTTGGNNEAEIATPISGPAEPCNNATATPVPEVKAHKTPIHKERTLPLYNGESIRIISITNTIIVSSRSSGSNP